MDKNLLKIRKATKKDIHFIKTLLIDSWVEHARQVPTLLDEERMKKSDVETYYKEALENENSFVYVAEVDSERAGLIRADIKDIPKFFKHNRIMFLDDAVVLPKFRRQGVARKLTEKIERVAKKNGIKRLQARVYSFNKGAQKLLKSMGYCCPHSTWDKRVEE